MTILKGIKSLAHINSWELDVDQVNMDIKRGDFIIHDNKSLNSFFKDKESAIDYAKSNNLTVDQISCVIGNKMVSIPINEATIL